MKATGPGGKIKEKNDTHKCIQGKEEGESHAEEKRSR